MATFNVIVYKIESDFNEPHYSNGYRTPFFVHVRLDDATNAISVQIRDASGEGAGSLISSPVTGPNLFFGFGGLATRLTPDPLYKFCDEETLRFIFPINTFPHGQLGESLNAVECQIAPVCDIEIASIPVVTPTTDPDTADGTIQVSATSSNGTIQYSLSEDFAVYNTTGLFTGLYANEYTVYARDAIGCLDTMVVTVPVTTVYGPKYRSEYATIRYRTGNNRKVEIWQRGYDGAVNVAKQGEVPFKLRYNTKADDKYFVINPSEAAVELMTETSEQYIELFTGDDRKYQVRFYVWESAAWVLKWIGFVVPQFYAEPYLHTPFTTVITASDNLKLFDTKDFKDQDGNVYRGDLSKMEILASLLKKTGLELPIRSCDNVFETTMNMTAADDPLPQSYVDSRIFYGDKKAPQKCKEVIQKILGVKGAKIYQSLGKWWIMRTENSVGEIEYREFDSNGVYSSNGTYDTLRYLVGPSNNNLTDSLCWRDTTQIMQLVPNHGEFIVTHNLVRDNNMIDSGSFESEYIKLTDNGSAFFEDWNFKLGMAGVKYGYEVVNNGNSIGAFYADFDTANPYLFATSDDSVLYSKSFPVSSAGKVKLKFQVFVAPDFNVEYSRIGYKVKLTNPDTLEVLYLFNVGASGSFINDGAGTDDWNDSGYINDLYVDKYNSWQTFETSFTVPAGTTPDDLEISFHFHNHSRADTSGVAGNFDELKAINTGSRLQNIRRKYHIDTDAGIISAYELQPSPATDSENLPVLVEPLDYGLGNESRWKLMSSYSAGVLGWVNKILIDEVALSEKVFISDTLAGKTALVDPPPNAIYSQVTNSYNFNLFEETTYLGDIPADMPNAAAIYRGYIRKSDGTPSVRWQRKGSVEEKLLNAILLEDYISQLKDSNRKLSGNVLTDWHYAFVNTLNDHVDDRKYINGFYELDDKQCNVRVDLLEIVTGDDGLPPPSGGEFAELEFSDDYNTGN
jgi:hypothetical protein